MAKSKTSERDEKHELTRRALIKWSVAAGAALGVSRSKIYEILDKTAGKGVAFAAEQRETTRLVALCAGNGGLANFQLLWPQVKVAQARNPDFAWHRPGMEQLVAGTNNPLAIGPDTPWAKLPAARQVTGFVCGRNETHTNNVQSTTVVNGINMFAFATALQAGAPAVLPAVTIGDATLGTAPGGATPANVANAQGIVGLFNSAASREGGLLAKTTDAELYKAHYEAFIQLNRAANRATTKTSYVTATGAAQFLGRNLSERLRITPEDEARYGINGNTRGNVAAIGRAFIVTVKAFSMGLTNAVVMPAMRDDPHGMFNGDFNIVPAQLKTVFDAFMDDLTATLDDATQTPLADDTVITINGDTPKDPLSRGGWPDGTPRNCNMVYIYSAGHLKSGWFGGVNPDGSVDGVGPDGKIAAYNATETAKYATASIAYAVSKRDDRKIQEFANGVTVAGVFGNIKAV
jgi:hypothetical protein